VMQPFPSLDSVWMLNFGADVVAGVDVMTRGRRDDRELVETAALLAAGCVTLGSDPVAGCETVVHIDPEEAVATVFLVLDTGSTAAVTACVGG